MTLSLNLMGLCLVLTLAALCEGKLGLHPDMTVENIKALFKDGERLARVKTCFFTGMDCNPVDKSLIDVFPEGYKTACANCDDRERQVFQVGSRISFLSDPVYFKTATTKVDPEGSYWSAYMKFVFPE